MSDGLIKVYILGMHACMYVLLIGRKHILDEPLIGDIGDRRKGALTGLLNRGQ